MSILKMGKNVFRIDDLLGESEILESLVREIIKSNLDKGLWKFDGEILIANSQQRLLIALRALELGADIERTCKFLTWEEFEDFAVLEFEANNFNVTKHFRFNWLGRRWEIDLLGIKKPFVVSADCKHWKRGWRGSSSLKAAEFQIERTKALAEASPLLIEKIGLHGWKEAYFMPIVLSLLPAANKFHMGCPIVPILQFRSLLVELPARIQEVAYYHKNFWSNKMTNLNKN
ncbi:MAG: hypothetical protein RMJ07_06245 [Nitrososphaerota archaeon]|nr:hypothetical protein [Candidatus Bathyarchaeota archaeon]MDW8049260.1 hypothetical protein [Nitrososphaerota archaeon]